MPGKMVDSFGRKVTGLRIALTPRCNLNCIYCHHEGEVKPKREILGEMVVSVARAAADLGVRSLKFTGGEPLLRRDLADLISADAPGSGHLLDHQRHLSGRAGRRRWPRPGWTG